MKECKYLTVACSMLFAVTLIAVAEDEPMIGDKPLPELLKQLRSENRGLQMRAAQALTAAPTNLHEKIIPQLIPMLKSERENDRFVAAQTLGNYGPASRAAVPDLVPLLKGTQYERNRAASAKSLGLILVNAPPSEEVDKVARALAEKLNEDYDSYSDVRRESVRAIGMIGPAARSVIPKLSKGLTDFVQYSVEHQMVRQQAAWTCGRMGPLAAEHVDRLVSMLNSEGEQLPQIVEALGLIGPVNPNIVPNIVNKIEAADVNIDAWSGFRATAFAALARIGPKAEGALAFTKRFLSQQPAPWDAHRMKISTEALKFLQTVGPKAKECAGEVEKLTKYPVPGDRGSDAAVSAKALQEEAVKTAELLKRADK
ncbi:MAG: hypothetical protein C0404_14435 [Verrucomicrobia bacterium]|nr:hypothetical protein [Verrucomicrobiota bacterium]